MESFAEFNDRRKREAHLQRKIDSLQQEIQLLYEQNEKLNYRNIQLLKLLNNEPTQNNNKVQ